MSSKKKVSILGVTGSVGQSAADVILAAPDHFKVHAVTAGQNAKALAEAAQQLKAKKAIIADESKLPELQQLLAATKIETTGGTEALIQCTAEPVDLVLAAIVGFAGLRPILSALENGINVAIANKEPLVAAGPLVMETAAKSGAKILPVDSEHNAIFQVFENHNRDAIQKIILTASGGPFRTSTQQQIENATLAQALKHPNWNMGAKISIDSATMMNKALEIIEAHYLFDMPPEQIEVIIHPQSIVHSMVCYADGSVLAQMGPSDMRVPIASALVWPERITAPVQHLDFTKLKKLQFEAPDFAKFPALQYAYDSLRQGLGATITLNAANEIAVEAFLKRQINFGDIMRCIAYALYEFYPGIAKKPLKTVEEIEELDNMVRLAAIAYLAQYTNTKKKAVTVS